MITSMTAFARQQHQSSLGVITCEIRSINHRYLDMNLYLPDMMRALEMPLRDLIRHALHRGKIECTLRYQGGNESETTFKLNEHVVNALCRASKEISKLFSTAMSMSSADVLRFPGVVETKEVSIQQLQQIILPLVKKTIEDLMAARAREGEELKQLFLNRIKKMVEQIQVVKENLPRVLKEQRERIIKHFHEAKVELDPTRLEQEMILFVHRTDVAEEIERLETHLHEVDRILKEGGLVGRRLDFLFQELNRETNTLASKSTDTQIAHAAVEMKVLIEQMREQVQNVE